MTESLQNLQQLKRNVFTEEQDKKRMSGPMKLALGLTLVATIIIVIFSIISVFTPQQIEIEQSPTYTTNFDNTQTKFTSLRFSGQEPTLPQQLPVAQRMQNFTAENVIQVIISAYQLRPHENLPGIWINGDASLQFDQETNTYTFVADGAIKENEELPLVIREEAVQSATSALQSLFPQLSLQPIQDKVTFLEIDIHYHETEPEEANGMNIPFAQYVGEYPVFNKTETQFPFLVTVDGNHKVTKITFSGTFHTFQARPETVPTIGLEQAFTNMKDSNASIIAARYIEGEVRLSDLDSAEFSTVDIEYREDEQQSIAYPFYRLKGTGFTKDQKSLDIEVLTPAVKTTTATQ